MTAEPPVRVVYIMGSGRSGSTVLDIALGAHPQVAAVGELAHLTSGGWNDGGFCACGRLTRDCPFWSEVRREWIRRIGSDDLPRYLALQDAFERLRRWPRLIRERRRLSGAFGDYARHTLALFEAIRAVSGKSVIVDSSKEPSRAIALSMISGIDLCAIHLLRDGRGVASSMKTAFKKGEQPGVVHDYRSLPVWQTAAYWILLNLQSTWLRRHLPVQRSILLRYEDFVTNPVGAVQAISASVGLDFTEVAQLVAGGSPLKISHTVAGNPIRMAGSVQLRLDEKWREQLSPHEQRLLWLLSGWLMRRYGYPK